jgi:hypothetical protein
MATHSGVRLRRTLSSMLVPSQLSHDVRFGEFVLDLRSRDLLADGCKVSALGS